ncbi:MAG: hypothetical protein J7M19_01690 [Planctomycetes bacterium]|nr:hypothetical protein [Planctomycetota bacterium]
MEKAVAFSLSRRKDSDRLFWVFAVAGLLLFAIVTIPPGARRASALKGDLQRARAIHARVKSREAAFLQCERALKSDPFFNEAVLRAKMKYTKPGEEVVGPAVRMSSVIPVALPAIAQFRPSRPSSPDTRQQVASWAMLLASALSLAAAFLLFDRPPALHGAGRHS